MASAFKQLNVCTILRVCKESHGIATATEVGLKVEKPSPEYHPKMTLIKMIQRRT